MGSLFGTDAAESAARAAANKNRKESTAAFDYASDTLDPYYQGGTQAYQNYNDYLGVNGQGAQKAAFDNYVQSPDVQYRVDQGIKAIDNSSAARTGGTLSGGLLKSLNKFGIGEATQDYGNFLSRLMGSAGVGSNAASNLVNSRYGSAGLTTGANTAEGNAIANANLAQGSILGSLINGGMKVAGAWNPFGFGK